MLSNRLCIVSIVSNQSCLLETHGNTIVMDVNAYMYVNALTLPSWDTDKSAKISMKLFLLSTAMVKRDGSGNPTIVFLHL